MPSLYNADLKPIGANEKTHDYSHAAKLFVADNFRLAPKQSFLFYVCLNVNQSVAAGLLSLVGANTESPSSQTLTEQYEAGLLVKKIDLPRFTINSKTYNAYNRKNLVTNTIQYDPITVTFHDDAADIVTNFWNDYYSYYYRDSDYDPALYKTSHKYTPRQRTKWGFTPRERRLDSFLRDIQIFSLHNKRFTEYRLINPIISGWRHGTHDADQGTGLMENQMTVLYETVKYRTGTVNPVDVNGFAFLHYDNFQSPISTSITNIYSEGGIIGAIANAGSKDLARPDGVGSGRGIFSSVLTAYTNYKNIKNANFKNLSQITLGQVGASVVNGTVNSALSGISFPTLNSTPGYSPDATSLIGNNNTIAASPYAQSTSIALGGAAAVASLGQGRNVANNTNLNQAQATVERGVATAAQPSSPAIGPTVGQIINQQPNPIAINPSSGQPYIGADQILVGDGRGGFIASQLTQNSVGFSFNPNNLNLNKTGEEIFTDGNYKTIVRTYSDNTVVGFDENNNILYTIPPGQQAYNYWDLKETNSSALRSLNVDTQTGTRFVTNPNTGIVTAVGGTTATVSNGITQGIAGAGGVIAGAKVYEALSKTSLGKTFVGQVFSGAVGAATAGVFYKVSNNLLQPIINKGVGSIGQVFDQGTQSIRNLVGTWSGAGGPTANPLQNIVSQQEVAGQVVTTYKDGSIVSFNPSTQQKTIVQSGTSDSNANNLFYDQAYYDYAAQTAAPGYTETDDSFNLIYADTSQRLSDIPDNEDQFGIGNQFDYGNLPGVRSSGWLGEGDNG